MMIPYRARKTLRKLGAAVLTLALIAAVVALCWLLWLNRYVIYTREGAKLNFDLSLEFSQGVAPEEPEPQPTVQVNYSSGSTEDVSTELVRFSGYYVNIAMLTEDFDAVCAQLESLPAGATVLLDVKSIQGEFYYATSLGGGPDGFDTAKMDGLIRTLQDAGHYLIARIPAFQEYDYILANQRERVPYGLAKKGGNGSLWLDKDGPCYWMNPASEGTVTYLIQIISELRGLGFDEVVLADYRFPNTDAITFDGDKAQTLADTAATLVKACSTDTFCVSFTRTAADLKLPEGRTRLYLQGAAAANAATLAGQAGFDDPSIRVVFLTDLNDTRFDEYSVLRPLSSAQ